MTFCDIESELLQKAIARYLNVCKREIRDGDHVLFTEHSATLKRIRTELRKETKGPVKVSFNWSRRYILEAALRSYVSAVEQEIAADVNKPFRPDMELAKTICEAMDVEYWRAVFHGRIDGRAKKVPVSDARLNTDRLHCLSPGLEYGRMIY